MRSRLIGIIAVAGLLALAGCASEPQKYLVFFQTDATVLTPEAQAVVAQIAQRNAAEHPARIIVEGQADGATSDETALADTRAARVATALSAAGVDAARIERRPGVPPQGAGGVAARKVLVTFVR